jgi:hypothetical protein
MFWHRVLRGLGQDAGLGETLRAYFIGHLGKYVPGKALVVILRAGLIRSHRVDPLVAGTSVFVETLTLMGVGGVLSAIIIPFWYPDSRRTDRTWPVMSIIWQRLPVLTANCLSMAFLPVAA